MSIKKRGVHRNKERGFYFKGNKIVLESTKSKIAFFGILFLFSMVVAFGVMDVYDSLSRVNGQSKNLEKVFLNPEESINIIVLKNDGNLVRNEGSNRRLNFENISRKFYESYGDDYDFISIFSNFPLTNLQTQNRVQNDIWGIGLLRIHDNTEEYGSGGRLLGINYLGSSLFEPYATTKSGIDAALHETGHRWCCFIGDDYGSGGSLEIIQQGVHCS